MCFIACQRLFVKCRMNFCTQPLIASARQPIALVGSPKPTMLQNPNPAIVEAPSANELNEMKHVLPIVGSYPHMIILKNQVATPHDQT